MPLHAINYLLPSEFSFYAFTLLLLLLIRMTKLAQLFRARGGWRIIWGFIVGDVQPFLVQNGTIENFQTSKLLHFSKLPNSLFPPHLFDGCLSVGKQTISRKLLSTRVGSCLFFLNRQRIEFKTKKRVFLSPVKTFRARVKTCGSTVRRPNGPKTGGL